MIEIPCEYCETKAYPTKEEAIKCKYLWCWFCSIDFKNPNYIENEKQM